MSADPILIIEDNEQNMYLTTFLLEGQGYRVAQARSGPEGLELAARVAPCMVLLDIQLPEMDGFAVLDALKREPALAVIPVVAVTSHAMAGDQERILEAGCDGYIEKPINPDTFIAEVESHMRPKPLGES